MPFFSKNDADKAVNSHFHTLLMEPKELFDFRKNILASTFNPVVTDVVAKNHLLSRINERLIPFDFFASSMASLQPALDAAAKMAARTLKPSAHSFLYSMFVPKPVTDYNRAITYQYWLDNVLKTAVTPYKFKPGQFKIPLLNELDYEWPGLPISTNGHQDDHQRQDTTAIVNESQQIKRIILDIYNSNQSLLDLDPRKFEEVIAELMAKQGFKIELTKQTRDGGYDILAILPVKLQSPMKWLVECKRFSEHRKVDVNVIRSFKEVIQAENANRGIIATTSYFTLDAKKKQQEIPYLMDFRDKDAVMQWVCEYASTFK